MNIEKRAEEILNGVENATQTRNSITADLCLELYHRMKPFYKMVADTRAGIDKTIKVLENFRSLCLGRLPACITDLGVSDTKGDIAIYRWKHFEEQHPESWPIRFSAGRGCTTVFRDIDNEWYRFPIDVEVFEGNSFRSYKPLTLLYWDRREYIMFTKPFIQKVVKDTLSHFNEGELEEIKDFFKDEMTKDNPLLVRYWPEYFYTLTVEKLPDAVAYAVGATRIAKTSDSPVLKRLFKEVAVMYGTLDFLVHASWFYIGKNQWESLFEALDFFCTEVPAQCARILDTIAGAKCAVDGVNGPVTFDAVPQNA